MENEWGTRSRGDQWKARIAALSQAEAGSVQFARHAIALTLQDGELTVVACPTKAPLAESSRTSQIADTQSVNAPNRLSVSATTG
jgi:hypothetical protein